MAKVKNRTAAMGWQEWFNLELYKPTQGRIARQATAGGVGMVVALGIWRLSNELSATVPGIRWGIPLSLAVVAAWLVFRLINYPRFADFLISTEAEMAKVSWPSRPELFRATVVVLGTLFLLATALFAFDIIWQLLFRLLGVLNVSA
jgi:preprotein translocase subunit SecE